MTIWDGDQTDDVIQANQRIRRSLRMTRKYGTRDAQHATVLILMACGIFGGFMYYIINTTLPH